MSPADLEGGSWSPPATPASETKQKADEGRMSVDMRMECSPAAPSQEFWSPPPHYPTSVNVSKLGNAELKSEALGLSNSSDAAVDATSHDAASHVRQSALAQEDDWVKLPDTLDDEPIPQPGPHAPGSWSPATCNAQPTGPVLADNIPASPQIRGNLGANAGIASASDGQQLQSHSQDMQAKQSPGGGGAAQQGLPSTTSAAHGSFSPQCHPQKQQQQEPMGKHQTHPIQGPDGSDHSGSVNPTAQVLQPQQQQELPSMGPQAQRSSSMRPSMSQAMSQSDPQAQRSSRMRPSMSHAMSQAMTQPGGSQQPRRSGGSSWLLQAARATGQLPSVPWPSQFAPSQPCHGHLVPSSIPRPVSRPFASLPEAGQDDQAHRGPSVGMQGTVPTINIRPHAASEHATVMNTSTGNAACAHADAMVENLGAAAAFADALGNSNPEASDSDDEAVPPTPFPDAKEDAGQRTLMGSPSLSPGSVPLAQRLDAAAGEGPCGKVLPCLPDQAMTQGNVPLADRMNASWPQGHAAEQASSVRQHGLLQTPYAEALSTVPLATRMQANAHGHAPDVSSKSQRDPVEGPLSETPLAARVAADSKLTSSALQRAAKAPSEGAATKQLLANISAAKPVGSSKPGPTCSAQHTSRGGDEKQDMSLAQRMKAHMASLQNSSQLLPLSQVRS